jgi:hypothetical protein
MGDKISGQVVYHKIRRVLWFTKKLLKQLVMRIEYLLAALPTHGFTHS